NAIAGYDGAIVADCKGSSGNGFTIVITRRIGRAVAPVEVGSAPAIVGLPGLIGRLKNDVACGVRILDDKRNLEDLVALDDIRDIYARNGVVGYCPSVSDAPIAGVDLSGCSIGDRIWLDRRCAAML